MKCDYPSANPFLLDFKVNLKCYGIRAKEVKERRSVALQKNFYLIDT
tara:strand:- start:35 stop:175 length:141 start_codon:yes stop_codon:yes gene_type:complete